MVHHGTSFSNWLHGGGFMAGPLGLILTVLFWAVVVLFVVKAYKLLFPARLNGLPTRSFNVLKERYAAGEISREEFERIKKDGRSLHE